MAIYGYKCPVCDKSEEVVKPMAQSKKAEPCPNCGAKMRKIIHIPNISGTRDGFGVNKAFIDPESGKEIDTWKKWEDAGYKPLKDSKATKRRARCEDKIKEKQDKLKGKITV